MSFARPALKSAILTDDRPYRMLLVEDDANDEWLTLRAIRECSFATDVLVARDGSQAAQALFGEDGFGGTVPDLIILDAKLPKISGHELLELVRRCERTHSAPVVMLSSSCDHEDVRKGYDSGANCYLQKPIDLEEYTALIRETVEYWLKTVRLPSRAPF